MLPGDSGQSGDSAADRGDRGDSGASGEMMAERGLVWDVHLDMRIGVNPTGKRGKRE